MFGRLLSCILLLRKVTLGPELEQNAVLQLKGIGVSHGCQLSNKIVYALNPVLLSHLGWMHHHE